MDFSFLFIIILIVAIGLIVTKLLFYVVNVKPKIKIDAAFISIPFSSLLFTKYIRRENLVSKINENTFFLIEILGGLAFLFYTISLINYITSNIVLINEAIVLIVLHLFFLVTFLYFAIHDTLRLKVPTKETRYFLLSVIVISLSVGLYRFIVYRSTGENILVNVPLGYLDNLFAAGFLSLIVFIFNKINKKNFGVADIDLVFSLGLILGFINSIFALFFISTIGLIVSLIHCIRLRKFRNVRVPFAPFLLLGYALVIGFGHRLIDLLSRI